jgi:succinate dehydrogenase (ubiquinone) membrane anchor subunit
MASSALRPALFRQAAGLAAPARQHAAASTLTRQSLRSAVTKDAVRVSAFHASSRRSLLPPGPQIIKGSVNDPAYVPDPHPTHGSYHWTFERLIAAGLIPLTVAPFAAGSINPATDAILCSLLLVHGHLGFQSVIIDYIPISRYPKSRKAATWGLKAATALVGVGLYEFETNDVGITEAIRRIWTA